MDSRYTLSVQASRIVNEAEKKLGLDASYLLDEQFRTGVVPDPPTLRVSPSTGVMYKDIFVIEVLVNNPKDLKYLVFGKLENGEKIQLSQAPKLLEEKPKTEGTLPQVVQVIIEIQNKFGEVSEKAQNIKVTKSEGTTWTNILEAQTGNADQIWQQYLFIAGDANIDATKISRQKGVSKEEKLQAEEDARTVNEKLAANGFDTIRRISKQSDDHTDQIVIQYMIQTIARVAKYSQFLESWTLPKDPTAENVVSVIQMSVETLEYVLRVEKIMIKINEDETQRFNFVKALGRLLDVTAERAQLQKALLKYLDKQPPNFSWTKNESEDNASQAQRFLEDDDWEGPLLNPNGHYRRNLQEEIGKNLILFLDKDMTHSLLDLYRDILLKIVVIKNAHLDQLCTLPEAEKVLTINSEKLQQSVLQIQSDINIDTLSQTTFKYSLSSADPKTDITANIPTKQLMHALKLKYGSPKGFKWMCLQVSFMQANPAAGFEQPTSQQFFFENQRIMQLNVVDSNGFRILEEKDKNSFGDAIIQTTYKQKMDVENYFFRNQTTCMNYNPNIAIGAEGQEWTSLKKDHEQLSEGQERLDCQHQYIVPDRDNGEVYGTIICTCSYVTNFYYTIITDLTRVLVNPYIPQNTQHQILLAIQVPLIIIGLVFPCIMIFLDAKDYQNVEDNIYPVDDETISKLEVARHALCKQEIYYKEKEISQYLQLQESDFRSGSGAAFSIFHRTMHPYFSLFTRFDYKKKRLTRFAFVLFQTSLITILLWLAYSNPAAEWISELIGFSVEDFEQRRWFFVSIILSIFTLPIPDRCCCIFRTDMYLINDISMTPKEIQWSHEAADPSQGGIESKSDKDQTKEEAKNTENDEKNEEGDEKENVTQNTQVETPLTGFKTAGGNNKMRKDMLLELQKSDPEFFVRPALFDRFLWCKLVGMLIIFSFWMLAIYISINFGNDSGIELPKNKLRDDPIENFIFLNPEQATEFVLTWYLTIFVWGVILNELRILIISLLAPIAGQSLFNKQIELMKDPNDPASIEALEKFHTGYFTKSSCSTCCLIPPESVDIALDALFTIDIKKHKNDATYQVKESDMKLVEEARKYMELAQNSAGDSNRKPQAVVQDVDIEKAINKKGGKKGKKSTRSTGSTKSGKSAKKKGKKKAKSEVQN